MSGPLTGYRIIELAGIGPAPMSAMMLGDMGADVIRVDRTKSHVMDRFADPKFNVHGRSRRSVSVDLQKPEGAEVVLRLCAKADGIMEPFRPGVAERLGVGPEACMKRNPKIVYGRMTGWGQTGPLAKAAGHDQNYIALTGALHAIGRKGQKPVPPLNLVGDFGGGGMLLAFGMVCALLEAKSSGRGQVVDAAMVDGAAVLMNIFHGMRQAGFWSEERGTNLLDTGAHFYDVYETSDGKYVSIGSIEPQFYAELLEKTGLSGLPLPHQMDRSKWAELKERLRGIFRTKTRDEWCKIMEGSDVCFAPVLSLSEAPEHPHVKARSTFVTVAGAVQAAPAPRFSRTPCEISRPPAHPGQHTDEALADWGLSPAEITKLREAKAIA